jgi:transcriptional regulator with XRE-family HTH domain
VSEQEYLRVVRRRIKQAREQAGFTQEEVAERSGLTLRHYQRYEAQRHPGFAVSLLTLRRIGKVVSKSVVDFVREPSQDELEALKQSRKK